MKYEYHISRPAGVSFGAGDLILERDESKPGAISLLKWLQDKFGEENVTLWAVIVAEHLERVRK